MAVGMATAQAGTSMTAGMAAYIMCTIKKITNKKAMNYFYF